MSSGGGPCVQCGKPADGTRDGETMLHRLGWVCSDACRIVVLRHHALEQDPTWTPPTPDASLDPDNAGPATVIDFAYDADGMYVRTRHREGPDFCQSCMGLFDESGRSLDKRPMVVPMGKTRQKLHAGCAARAHDVKTPGPSIVVDLGRDMGRSLIAGARKAEQAGIEAGRGILKKLGF